MRERLAASFVLLAVALLTVVGLVRSYTLSHEIREHESGQLRHQAVIIGILVKDRLRLGGPVDQAFLAPLAGPDDRVVWTPRSGAPVEVRGSSYGSGREVAASVAAAGGRVTVAQDDRVARGILVGDPWALVVLVGLALLGAAGAGLLVARVLAAPFRRLAGAAEALGRGRFDLDLPRTRMPEAAAIAQSLQVSADQLRERVRRDQELAAHTSHALRSPLTGLRLELEEVLLRDDLAGDVRTTVGRALAGITHVDRVAGELVELQRGSLAEAAGIPLRDLATQVAQRWADQLVPLDRELTAAVEGELERRYTPGPVEHLLDLVLAEVVAGSLGGVRLVLVGDPDGHLRITLTTERSARRTAGDGFAAARSVCAALGGRWSGETPMDGVEILLPQR